MPDQSFSDALAGAAITNEPEPPSFSDALSSSAVDIAPPRHVQTAPEWEGTPGPGVFQGPATITEPAAPQPVFTRGRFTGLPGHDITSQSPDIGISEGLKQVATAIPALSEKAGRVLTHPEEGIRPTEETLNQMADVLEGAAKVSTPLAIGAALVNLPGTVLTLGSSWLAANATKQAAEYAQASPGTQRFLSALAGTAVAVGGAQRMISALDDAAAGTGRAIGRTVRDVTTEQPFIDVKAGTPPAEPMEPTEAVAGSRTLPPGPPAEPPAAPVGPDTPPTPPAPPQVAPDALAPETPETRLASLQPTEPGNSRAVPFRVDISPLADQLTQAAVGMKPVERDVPMGGVVATQPSIDPGIVTGYLKTRAPLTGKLPTVVEWQNQFYVIDGTHRAVTEWALGAPTLKANVITPDPAKVAQLAAPRPPTPPSGVIRPQTGTPTPAGPAPIKPDFAALRQAHAEKMTTLSDRFERDGYLEGRSTQNPTQTITLTPSTRAGVKYQVTTFENGEPVGHRDYSVLSGGGPTQNALSEFLNVELVPNAPDLSAALASAAEPQKLASTQVNLPHAMGRTLKALGASIPDDALAEHGREDDPHVTVKYGIHTWNPSEVKKLLKDEPPVTVVFGKTSLFPDTGNGDVLKVDVDSPDLHKLNAKIAAGLKTTDTHPEYKPHATVAYLKPGRGKEYVGRSDMAGKTFTIDMLVFSTPDGEKYEVPLKGVKSPRASDQGTTPEAVASAQEPGSQPQGGDQGSPRPRTDQEAKAERRKRGKERFAEYQAAVKNAPKEVIDGLVKDAHAGGYTGDPEVLRTELQDRLQHITEFDQEFEGSGRNGQELLRAVAGYGGLSKERETARKGEMAWLDEHAAGGTRKAPAFGTVNGVKGVRLKDGLTFDEMLHRLQQEPKFEHLETVNDLIDALRDAITTTPDGVAADRLKAGLGDRWWERIRPVATNFEDDLDELRAADEGDTSFDVNEFGEEQPRLPEAGSVREREVAHPDVAEVPFSLTGEAEHRKAVEPSLFEDEKPKFAKRKDRLSVLHNLDARNLIYADKIGGLAVPSLGVVTDEMGIKGMGDITLIGRAHLGNPAYEPIHDADVYSQTFPKPEYDRARHADVERVFNRLKPFTEAFDDYPARQVTWDDAVNSPNPQNIIQRWLSGLAAKAMYLAEHGTPVEPITEPARMELPWVKCLDYKRFRELQPFNDERSDEEKQSTAKQVKALLVAAIDKYLTTDKDGKALLAHISSREEAVQRPNRKDDMDAARESAATVWGVRGDWVNDPDAEVPFQLDWKITDNHNKVGTKDVERTKTSKRIDAAMKGREADFTQWVESTVLGMFGQPFIRVNRRKVPYTLAHIVDYMTGPIRAQEGSLTFGEGKARASAAKRFTDLEQMRRSIGQLADDETINEKREEAKQLIEAFRNKVVNYYGRDRYGSGEFGRVWEGLDASMRAMAWWANGGKTPQRMRTALAREGFDVSRLDDEDIDEGVEAGKAFLRAPVPYFEVKPQRAVNLNEFAGAVIPKKSSPEVRAVLDKHGIPYREYTPGKVHAEAQRAAVVKFRDELARATAPDVLFGKRPEELNTENLREAARDQWELLHKTYNGVELIPLAGRKAPVAFFDAGGRFTKAELQQMIDSPDLQRVSVAVMDVLDEVLAKVVKADQSGIERTGIVFDDHTFGVYIPKPGSSHGPNKRATILLNPLEATIPAKSPQQAAAIMVTTAVHEALHWHIALDGPEFEAALASLLERLGASFLADASRRIMETYADVDDQAQYRQGLRTLLSLYSESRRRRAVTRDSLSESNRRQTRPADVARAGDKPPPHLRSSRARVVTRDELKKLADKRGTTVRIERERAVDAGYEIQDEGLLEPTVAQLAEAVKNEQNLVLGLLAPARVGVAPIVAGNIRAHTSANDQRKARVVKSLDAIKKKMDRWSEAQSMTFIDVMEGAKPLDALDKDWQPIAQAFRKTLNDWRALLLKYDLLDNYLDHYWPHEWKQESVEGKSLRKLFARRPMQGTEAYRKHRTIPTFRQGVDFGLVPATWNPAEQLQRKVFEMSQSVKGRELHADNIKSGLYAYVPSTKPKPEAIRHWQRVPEYALGTKFGPPTMTPAGRVVLGHYYAPPEVVRLVENHLSPGLWGKSVLYDAYKRAGNVTTQMLLGWSTFHLWLTGLESVISKASVATELLSRGEFSAAAKVGIQVGPQGIVRDLMRGYRAIQQFYSRDADANEDTGLIGTIVQAGGGFGWSDLEHENAPAKFMTAMRGLMGAVQRGEPVTATKKAGKATLQGAMAAYELPTSAIMNYWVPYLKVSAFLDMADMELRRMGADATLAEKRKVLGDAWDAVDDRFGQLRYDNLFWNNTFKQLLTGGFLSVGWQVGSLRHGIGVLGQGVRIGQNLRALAGGGGGRKGPPGIPTRPDWWGREGEPPANMRQSQPWLQRNMAWLFQLALIAGLLGAIYHYLHTGKRPESLKDLYYPRNGKIDPNGRDERDSLISYAKDYLSWFRHPVTSLGHKLKPFLSQLWDITRNEDFYGTEIRNPDDPALKQFEDVIKHWAKSQGPIAYENALRRAGDASTAMERLKAWAAIQLVPFTPASAEIERSDAENYLHDLYPPTHRTQEQQKLADARRILREETTEKTPGRLKEARQAGLSQRSIQATLRSQRLGYLRSSFERTTWPQAVKTYDLATPDERKLLKPLLAEKFGRMLGNAGTPDARKSMIAERNRLMKLPTAPTIH